MSLKVDTPWVYDIRWSEDAFLLAAGKKGVVVANPEGERLGLVYPGREQTHYARSLATSSTWVAGIGPMLTLTTHDRKSDKTTGNYSFGERDERSELIFDILHDIDVRGERVALIGSLRGKDSYAPRGELAWSAPLDALAPVVPLRRSLAFKPAMGKTDFFIGSPNMADCGSLGTGRIRFLDDETVLVAPGVEPNLYRVNALNGSLIPPIWSTDSLGVDTSCRLDEKEKVRFNGSVEYRQERYLNQRRTIDEILPLPGARFGLILREVRSGKVFWELAVFPLGGTEPEARLAIPIESLSTWEHLRADIRDEQIVFLVTSFAEEEATRRPRFVVARWQEDSLSQ